MQARIELTEEVAELGRAVSRRRATIVFIDVVESVRLMQADETGTVRRWRALVESIERDVLASMDGRLAKSMGDGLMLEFVDPIRAVAAALSIQRMARLANEGIAPNRRIRLRVGAHTGEHLADHLDLYGHDINLAARVMTLAGPGEIAVSAAVRDQIVDTVDAQIEDLGDCWLKHVANPIRCYRLGPPGPEPAMEPATPEYALRPTLAVVPPDARACAPEHEVLGEVIADELIGALSRSGEIDVISRLTTSALRGRRLSPGELAQKIGATFLVSGHYRVSGKQVIVSIELCHARSSRILWAETMRATIGGTLSGQSAMFDRILDAVRASLVSTAVQRTQSRALPTLESFTLMMAAIAMMHRQSPADYDLARRALQIVIDRAPRQPIPRAWLAKWHVLCLMQGWSYDATGATAAALDEARRAIDLDSTCSLALAVDGLAQMHFVRRLDIAEERFDAALASNPNDSLAWILKSTMHAFRGEGRLAMHAAGRARQLSPLDPIRYYYDSLSATAALAGGEPARAVELAERSLRANRRHTSTLRALTVARWQTGDAAGARQAVQELLRLEPQLTVSAWRARSPSLGYGICEEWTEAFRAAGLPP